MVNLSPKLRFPEFSGNWKSKKLEEVGSLINGLTYSPDDIHDDGVLVLRSSNIKENQLSFNDNVYVNTDNYNAVKEDDILICVRNGSRNLIGKNALITKEAEGVAFGAFMSVYRSELNKFVFQLFATDTYYKIIQENLGATINSINNSDLKKFEFYFPLKEEQDKIADFLNQIDTKINQLSKKKELLEQYKKGIMQQIFNQEIRFKDDNGNDYPKWSIEILGKISDVRDGTHESPKYVNIGFPLITSKNLNKNGKLDFKNVEYITQVDFDNINKRSKVDVGDIIFGMIGTIGNPVLLKRDDFAIKNVALIKENGLLKNEYLIHYLNSHIIEKQFKKENVGGTQKFISLGVIRNLEIILPSTLEQIKIANFLASIDDKINHITIQLDGVKDFKKGLLQQMFI
jgi:type I restriction enzyme S subunit